MGWANTGAELHDQLRRIGAEAFNHLSDRVCHDAKLGAFASGVHKANCRCIWIDDVDCATVCDVNAERDTALIGDNAIARGEFAATTPLRPRTLQPIDYCDFVTVDLFGGEQRPIPKPVALRISRCAASSRSKHFGFIVGDVDAGNSLR